MPTLSSMLTEEQRQQADTETEKLYRRARQRTRKTREAWQLWQQQTWGRIARKILQDAKPKTEQEQRIANERQQAKQARRSMAKQYNNR